jgi:hypothetical protein
VNNFSCAHTLTTKQTFFWVKLFEYFERWLAPTAVSPPTKTTLAAAADAQAISFFHLFGASRRRL